MIALDTNLLVYAFNPGKPEHALARRAIDRLAAGGDEWGFTLANVVELWNLMTRSAGGPMATPTRTSRYVAELVSAGAQIWQPLDGFGQQLVATAGVQGISGRRIFDWQIALTAIQNGVTELWTHDRSFRAPVTLRIVDPLS